MSRRRALLQVRSHQARLEAAAPEREVETPPAAKDLAAEYEELFGKKPGNMKPETMAERIAAKKDDAKDDDAE